MLKSKKHSDTPSTPDLLSYQTIRRIIGFVGLFMPIGLVMGTFLFTNCREIQPSISNYYYTVMGNVFTGCLCIVGIYLITYRGFDNDYIATNLAGALAFFVAFFPTNITSGSGCTILDLDANSFRNGVHLASASLFFITLSYISLFLFTKSNKALTKQKRHRNTIYKICGYVMIISLLIILLFKSGVLKDPNDNFKIVFTFETISLFAFGISWLTKGELYLKDKK